MHITAVDEHPYPTEEPRGSVGPSVYSHPTRGFYRSWQRIQRNVSHPYDSSIATDCTKKLGFHFRQGRDTFLYMEIKYQLDAIDEFLLQILLLVQHVSGHHYAHHQELESIIQMFAACGIWCFGFQVVGMVGS